MRGDNVRLHSASRRNVHEHSTSGDNVRGHSSNRLATPRFAALRLTAFAVLLMLTAAGCSELEFLTFSSGGDTTTKRTFIPLSTQFPSDVSGLTQEQINALPAQTGEAFETTTLGDIGEWRLYQDKDNFTDLLEVGALLTADNGFRLEVECSDRTDSLNVRLDIDVPLGADWNGEKVTKAFEMRLGGEDANVDSRTDWYVASNEDWPGDDNKDWLVSPNALQFTKSLIDNDAGTLRIRYSADTGTSDDDTDTNSDTTASGETSTTAQSGTFTLTGGAVALPTVLAACSTPGYETSPDLFLLGKIVNQSTTTTTTTTTAAVPTDSSSEQATQEILNALQDALQDIVSEQDATDVLREMFQAVQSASSLEDALNKIAEIDSWQSALATLTDENLLQTALEAFGDTSQPTSTDVDTTSSTTVTDGEIDTQGKTGTGASGQTGAQPTLNSLEEILLQSCSALAAIVTPSTGCAAFSECMVPATQTWLDSQNNMTVQSFGEALLADNQPDWIDDYILAVLIQADECA